MRKGLLFLGFVCYFSLNLLAQSPGAIAFIGINGDNDDQFAFVVIDDLPDGTEIFFTDSGLLSDGVTFRGSEGGIKYTVPAGGLTQGNVVSITIVSGAPTTVSDGTAVVANDAATVGINGIALSTDGDQMIALIGSYASPTFIAAIQTNATVYQTAATSAQNSALPTGLVLGSTAVAVGNSATDLDEFDNSEYTGSRGSFADRATALSTINNNTNWTGNNTRINLNTVDFTTPLPIELTYFTAKPTTNNQVSLEWRTESELNNDYMAVERSQDGQKFVELGKVKGAGTTVEAQTYSFLDEAPKAGVNYYRLRQVDFDGTTTFHKVVAATMGANAKATVYPTLVNAEINVVVNGRANVQIANMLGQVVKTVVVADFATLNVSDLTAGTYFLMIEGNEAVRFVKQ